MKKLFFALILSLVGLFFSNFIIPSSSENVKKLEVVKPPLPIQNIFIKNNSTTERSAIIRIDGVIVDAMLENGEVYSNTFIGNSLEVNIESPDILGSNSLKIDASYTMYMNDGEISAPICTDSYTFTDSNSPTKTFYCFIENNH